MKNLIRTSEKIEVKNYPYGGKRTTLFDYIEFDPKKGYRYCTQTINPKTGRLNNPKKSTYSPLMVRYYNEINHIKTLVFSFFGDKEVNNTLQFLHSNFDLFTSQETEYLYMLILAYTKNSIKGSMVYNGAKFEDLKPLYEPLIKAMAKGVNNPTENLFNVQLDIEAIKKAEDPNFQPFKTTKAVNILDL